MTDKLTEHFIVGGGRRRLFTQRRRSLKQSKYKKKLDFVGLTTWICNDWDLEFGLDLVNNLPGSFLQICVSILLQSSLNSTVSMTVSAL